MSDARVPQTWAELADEIGPAAALALSAAYGGVNVYIPGRMTRGHPIAQLFEATGAGFGAALALSELHGDTTMHVPHLSVFLRIRQAARALELLHNGATPDQAADALGISTRTLRRTLEFAQSIALQARRRRDSRRLHRMALRGAHDAWQLPLFGDLPGMLRQIAAGGTTADGNNASLGDKEMSDGLRDGEDSQKPHRAGRSARARRSGERAAVNRA